MLVVVVVVVLRTPRRESVFWNESEKQQQRFNRGSAPMEILYPLKLFQLLLLTLTLLKNSKILIIFNFIIII